MMTAVTVTPTPQLRLTQRGRIVFGMLATVLVAASLALVASVSAPHAQASDAEAEASFHYVIAQPGTTLWSLATELDPKMDPRDLVAEMVKLNQFDGSGVQAGEAIAVPLRYSADESVFSADELGL